MTYYISNIIVIIIHSYSYYRQFLLYKYIFCPKEKLIITQTMPQEVEIPLMPTYYTLDEGLRIVEPKVEEIDAVVDTEENTES